MGPERVLSPLCFFPHQTIDCLCLGKLISLVAIQLSKVDFQHSGR